MICLVKFVITFFECIGELQARIIKHYLCQNNSVPCRLKQTRQFGSYPRLIHHAINQLPPQLMLCPVPDKTLSSTGRRKCFFFALKIRVVPFVPLHTRFFFGNQVCSFQFYLMVSTSRLNSLDLRFHLISLTLVLELFQTTSLWPIVKF